MSDFSHECAKLDFGERTLSLQVPANEFGADSDATIEIIVEYVVNQVNTDELLVNIWAIKSDMNAKCHLGVLQLPVEKNEQPVGRAIRILTALDESDIIQTQLPQYFEMQLQIDDKGFIHLGRPAEQ